MRRKIDLIILLVVLVASGFSIKNAQALGDWWHSQRYTPSAEIEKLADDAGMNEKGKSLFYRFSPQQVDQQKLDKYCSDEKLGCVEGQSLYILQASNSKENNRNIVTAAHEMLHIAYSRLKPAEREDLQPLLKAELDRSTAENIINKLKGYPTEDYNNEAHSFIGSELPVTNPELNSYFNKYFSDRGKSIQAYSASL